MKNDYKFFSLTSSILPTISFSFLFPSPGYRNLQGSVWGIKVTTGRKRAWILSTFQFSTTFWLSAHFQPFTSHCTGHHPKLICPRFLIFPFFSLLHSHYLCSRPLQLVWQGREEKRTALAVETQQWTGSPAFTHLGQGCKSGKTTWPDKHVGTVHTVIQSQLESQCYTPIIFLSLVSPLFQPFSTLLKLPSQPWCLLLS